MAGYTRQSTFADGDTITAALFNNEYNQLLNAFSNTGGHKHDGTANEGPVIGLIGDAGETSPNNKVLIDTTNNYIEFYVEVSSAPVQQLYIADGAIIPVTDSDIDLGTTSLRFKDTYTDTVTTTGNVSIGGDLTVTGSATISGNLTFGDADTDSINLAAEIDSDIIPNTDGTYDLGSATKEWQDLYIDGTANIDSLVADTADINGGTIDGATIATSDITVGAGKTLDVSSGTLTLADDQISGDKVEGGTIAATTITSLTATSVDINGGTIDGVTIGGTTAGAVTFTDLSDGTITIAGFADEDNMSSNSATLLPTQQSVKAYVDSQVTAQDLDFQGDTGGALSIDLDSESLTIAGGTGLDTVGSGNTVTVNIDSTVATLTGSQTLTNKTLTTPVISSISNTGTLTLPTSTDTLVGRATTDTLTNKTLTSATLTSPVINTGVSGTAFLDDDTFATATASTLASSESIKAYVDTTVAATNEVVEDTTPQLGGDLDLNSSDITGTGDINITGTITSSGNITGTLATAAQPNITSVGTLTGLDVAGTPTFDGLTVDGATALNNSSAGTTVATVSGDYAASGDVKLLAFQRNGGAVAGAITYADASTGMEIGTTTSHTLALTTGDTQRLRIDSNGDISFYDDTGTSQALFWDASAESLGIGTTSPSQKLDVNGNISMSGAGTNPRYVVLGDETNTYAGSLVIQAGGGSAAFGGGLIAYGHSHASKAGDIVAGISSGSGGSFRVNTTGIDTGSDVFVVEASGNVGIGTDSPAANLHVNRNTNTANNLDSLGFDVAATIGNAASNPGNHYTSGLRLFQGSGTVGSGLGVFYIGADNGAAAATNDYTGQLLAPSGMTGGIKLNAADSSGTVRFETAGSERMRIDSSGNVGIGTTSPSYKLSLADTTQAGTTIQLFRTGSAAGSMFINGGLAFGADGGNGDTQRMVISSSTGNVGIGTTSPSAPLHISNTYPVIRLTDSDGAAPYGQIINSAGILQLRADDGNSTANSSMQFFVDGGEKARIDSSGNLLVGKTVADVATAGTALRGSTSSIFTVSGSVDTQVAIFNKTSVDGAIIDFRKDGTSVGSIGVEGGDLAIGNGDAGIQFVNGNEHFRPFNVTTNAATDNLMDIGSSSKRFKDLYLSNAVKVGSYATELLDGGLKFKFNGGAFIDQNTVGQPLTFRVSNASSIDTTTMTLDSSGKVGIGTSSPSAYNAQLASFKDGGSFAYLGHNNTGGTFPKVSALSFGSNAVSHTHTTNGGTVALTGSAQIAAIQSASSNAVTDMAFYTTSGGSVAEKMRIDSSGNLLVGTTSAVHSSNTIQRDSYNPVLSVIDSNPLNTGSRIALNVRAGTNSSADSSSILIRFQRGDGTTVGSVSRSGTSAVAYNTSSDYRLKENVDYDFTALDRVAQLKPARFNFIADEDTTVDGFIAHEVQDIVPEAVTGEKDAVDDEGNPEYQGIDQSKLVPLLTKAIQEQQTIIDDLKSRIEALEG